MKNMMSVDLEDYFCDLPYSTWPDYPSRIEKTTNTLLELFQKYDVKATFFALGYFADKNPALIKTIAEQGHEIASHSYSHCDLRKTPQDEIYQDLKKSVDSLQKASGQVIRGFRAPFFSISKNNLATFQTIKKLFKYDSSIFPVRSPLYGIPDASRFPYKTNSSMPLQQNKDGELLEIPPSTIHIPLLGNIPIAGGFYLRFLPASLIKFGIRRLNKKSIPAMMYIHPKDLDSDMPKIDSYSWHYYYGLKNAKKKFESILQDFTFCSVRDYYGF